MAVQSALPMLIWMENWRRQEVALFHSPRRRPAHFHSSDRLYSGRTRDGTEGFLIVTATVDKGLADIRSRRPQVSSTADIHSSVSADTAILSHPEGKFLLPVVKSGLRNPHFSANFPDAGAGFGLFQRKRALFFGITGLFHALADAKHREDLDEAMAKRQTSSELHSIQIFTLLKQNTELTILIKDMTERIDSLTQELAKAQGVCNT